MESKLLQRAGNSLKVQFDLNHKAKDRNLTLTSPMFVIGTLAFQIQVFSYRSHMNQSSYIRGMITISIKFHKKLKNDNLTYICEIITSEIKMAYTFTNDENWRHVACKSTTDCSTDLPLTVSFIIDLKIDTVNGNGAFASMYDDSDLTDFKLCGVGGSVDVHSAVLACISPVMKTMLSGKWKEVSEGKIDVADITKETLQHLKDYVYLNNLPEGEDIKPLLLLGSYYMIPSLVTNCIVKIMGTLNNDNIAELTELAIKYGITTLLYTILNVVESGGLDICSKIENL